MPTEENISRREKKPQGLFSNPVPWVGAIASISVFAITASFNWALSVQEKLVEQDSRIKTLELAYLEFKSDVREIKENVIYLRLNAPPKPGTERMTR